jgi:hypothetical protein
MQNNKAEGTRIKLLNLTQSSNALLIKVSENSIDLLVQEVIRVVTDKLLCAIDRYISRAELCVGQMAFAWSKGRLSGSDLDLTYATLWDFQQQFPDVASFNLADAAHGNFVSVRNLLDGFEVDFKNTSNATCSVCEPGALGADKYYYRATRPYQLTGLARFKHAPYDARTRPWYIAEAAGGGRGRWAELSGFSSGINVGSSAGQLVLDAAGAPLGIVNADLQLSLLCRYLVDVRDALVNGTAAVGPAEHALAAAQLHLALVDRLGQLVGTSTNDSTAVLVAGAAQPVAWNAAVTTPSLRAGLAAVAAAFAGDWAAALGAGRGAHAAEGPGGAGLFVSATPYESAWGLRLLLVCVCPKVYIYIYIYIYIYWLRLLLVCVCPKV